METYKLWKALAARYVCPNTYGCDRCHEIFGEDKCPDTVNSHISADEIVELIAKVHKAFKKRLNEETFDWEITDDEFVNLLEAANET